jgi:hypothetical protein
VIYVNFLGKALEYGGEEKLILCYDEARLDTTFREVPTSTPAEKLARLLERFPTRLTSDDGQMFWYSRLPDTDKRIATPYEVAYARWIPEDPWAALRCLLVLGSAGVDLVGRVKRALRAAPRFRPAASSEGAV